MKITIFLALLCLELSVVTSEKILVLAFLSSKSHKITYMSLMEELASRGHNITVVTPVKPFKTIENVTEVFTYDSGMFERFDPVKMKEQGQVLNPLQVLDQMLEVCDKSFDLPQVKALLNEQFDLVFMQPFMSDCALGIVYKLKAPLVIFTPVSAPGMVAARIGGFLPPSFVPSFMLPYSDEMSFKERMYNYGLEIFFAVYQNFFSEPAMEKIYREKLDDETIPPIREIYGNASLILSNGHFSISGPKPYLPNVVDVGGIHSRKAKPVPKDLSDFISSNPNGFILFSMGSIIKTEMMPEEKRLMFLNVFRKLNVNVIWKWDTEQMSDLPKNVKLSKWLPQQDLLGHKDIKMFMTHCGGGGTEEAIYHGVPLLGMPVFGDQPLNAQQAKRLGFLHEIDWNELNEERLTAAINEVLNNPKYRDNVKRLSTIFKDQPDEPLQRGVYWIEYVMRHKGAPQLQSAGRKLNWIQYHSWDVMAAYISIILTVIWLICKIFKTIFRFFCGGKKQDFIKKQQ